VELATVTGINWLRNILGNKTVFEATYGHGVAIKQQTFSIISTGVPITAEMDNDTFLRELEEANNVPTGTIVKGSWVKPIERRTKNQTIAFARLSITSVATANSLIARGVTICSKRCRTFRSIKEPSQCLKCQEWTPHHFAKDCTNKRACSTCGQDHKSKDCNARDRPYCISCRTHFHASWDRGWPARKAECQKMDSRQPEDTSPFFYEPGKPHTYPIAAPPQTTQATGLPGFTTPNFSTQQNHTQNMSTRGDQEWTQVSYSQTDRERTPNPGLGDNGYAP
jgi:hypothetical protein